MNLKAFGFRYLLEDDEIVEVVFRKPFMPAFLKLLFYVIVISGVNFFLFFLLPKNIWWLPILVGIYGVYFLFEIFARWWSNSILLTSESIVFVSYERLFYASVKRLDYWDLDSIEIEREGIVSYIRDLGNLVFAKISGGEAIIFPEIHRPKKISKHIREVREKMVDEKNFTEEGALKNLLSQMVISHTRVNGQPNRENEEIVDTKEKNFSAKTEKNTKTMLVEVELDDEGGIEIDLNT